jgi:hypothetical protein
MSFQSTASPNVAHVSMSQIPTQIEPKFHVIVKANKALNVSAVEFSEEKLLLVPDDWSNGIVAMIMIKQVLCHLKDAISQKPFLPETYKRVNFWNDFSVAQKIKIHSFWYSLRPEIKEVYIRSCVAKQNQVGNISNSSNDNQTSSTSVIVGPSGSVPIENGTIPDWNIDDYARLIHMVSDNRLAADWNEILQVFKDLLFVYYSPSFRLLSLAAKESSRPRRQTSHPWNWMQRWYSTVSH